MQTAQLNHQNQVASDFCSGLLTPFLLFTTSINSSRGLVLQREFVLTYQVLDLLVWTLDCYYLSIFAAADPLIKTLY